MTSRPEWPKPVIIPARTAVERLDENTGQPMAFSLLQGLPGELRATTLSWGGVLTDLGILVVHLDVLIPS